MASVCSDTISVATRPETVESPVFPYHPKIMLVHTRYINEDYNKVAEGQLMR